MKRRQMIRKVCVILILSLLSPLVVELAAQLYLQGHPLPPTTEEYRRTQPPPYLNAPYFSQEFITEAFQQPGGWIIDNDTRLILPNDFEGTWFNVRDHRRVTTDQPLSATRTIYLFGGSTVYDSEVPDSYTIASQLQRLIGDRYRVENMGSTSVTVAQQVARLRTVELHPADIVIFYDGVNDVSQGVLFGNPGGWIVGENRKNYGLREQISETFSYLAMVRLAFSHPPNTPDYLLDAAQRDTLVKLTRDSFVSSVTEAQQIVEEQEATFYHFLQPHLFTQAFSKSEMKTFGDLNVTSPGTQIAFDFSYPALRTATLSLKNSYDISESFRDARMNDEGIFFDFCHVAHRGNELIAQAIWEVLESSDIQERTAPGIEASHL